MFNRYWRSYPWYLQLLLFVLMMFTLMSFSQYLLLMLAPKMTGVALKDFVTLTKDSPVQAIRAGLVVQLLSHFMSFTLLGLLFAYFTTPHVKSYLGMRRPGREMHWLLSVAIIIGLLPLLIAGQSLMQQYIPLGDAATKMQQATQNTVDAFLSLKGAGNYTLLLISVVLLPAFGEELVFRGILMRFSHKYLKGVAFSVILSAVLFAGMHMVPYGMPFIFIAGIVLALIYWYTRSIWCAMLAHAVFNGSQILISGSEPLGSMGRGDNLPPWVVLAGAVLFGLSFYLLYRLRTPLPNDWSNDYLPEEKGEDEFPASIVGKDKA